MADLFTNMPSQEGAQKIHQLLQSEADGSLPDWAHEHMATARAEGWMPPPLVGATTTPYAPTSMEPYPIGKGHTPGPIPTPPSLSTGQKVQLGAAQASDALGTDFQKFTESLTDPVALSGLAAGGLTTAAGHPWAAIPAAGAATTAAETLKHMYEQYKAGAVPTPPTAGTMAGAFMSGAAGELLGKAPIGPSRPMISGAGKEAAAFYGEKAGAQQLTDSSALDIASNFAQYGAKGKPVMSAARKARSEQLHEHLLTTAEKQSPTGELTSNVTSESGYDPSLAGRRYQDEVAQQLKDLPGKSGYQDFLKTYGDLKEGGDAGASIAQLHKRRSAALERSRDAYRAGDTKAQQESMKQADRSMNRINKLLPEEGQNQYSQISNAYRKEITRLDNETVYNLRRDTLSDDVVDNILRGKLKNDAPIELRRGQSRAELLTAVKASHPSPESWAQTQADITHDLVQRSIDPDTGNLSYKLMRKQMDGLSDDYKEGLYGKAYPEIQKALRLLETEEPKSEIGRLFLAIKQPGAVMSLPQQLASGSFLAAAHGSAILGGPYLLAKALNSPAMRHVLINAAGPAGPVKKVATETMKRWAAQAMTELGRSTLDPEKPPPITSKSQIPEPPNAR